jgi:hypothetical protein
MTDSSKSDLRRRLRDARARPWLTNSVVRRRSTTETSSGLTESKDAPKLSVGTIVTAVPASLSSGSVSGSSEKQSGNQPKKPPHAAAKVKALARAVGSKIPVWVGLSCAFSRCSLQASDSEERKTKDTTAAHPTVTKDTPASRLPVRIWRSIAARRPAFRRVRRSNTPGAHAGVSKGKGAGKTQQIGVSAPAALNQGGIGKEPLRATREGVKPRSILKHQVESSGEAKPSPLTSLGQGVESVPKKTVMWQEKLVSASVLCKWEAPPAWKCRRCQHSEYQGERCVCPKATAESQSSQRTIQEWLKSQLALGYDNVNNPVRVWEVAGGKLRYELLTLETPTR